MKKAILVTALLAAALLTVNAQTDFFSDFGSHVPAIEEKYPDIVSAVESASDFISDLTDYIPTPSEMIEYITDKELPIDPSDVAVNAYIENSPMLSFYPEENISAQLQGGNNLRIFGISGSESKKHLILIFSDGGNEELSRTSITRASNGEFDKTVRIPDSDYNTVSVEIYTGDRAYGEFTSWVYNYLYLEKNADGIWSIAKSPVYDHNKAMYTSDKSVKEALRDTPAIESDDDDIISLAQTITANATSDYDKLIRIHDWVCENIRYDVDNLYSSEIMPYKAGEVLSSKTAVCLGFSTLTASLCRSVGIPCNVVSGYALGVGNDDNWNENNINTTEQNHAWNEAYVDGRWVILDTTWDCANKTENGETVTGEMSHIYFDANIDFFSSNHKLTEYMKRP